MITHLPVTTQHNSNRLASYNNIHMFGHHHTCVNIIHLYLDVTPVGVLYMASLVDSKCIQSSSMTLVVSGRSPWSRVGHGKQGFITLRLHGIVNCDRNKIIYNIALQVHKGMPLLGAWYRWFSVSPLPGAWAQNWTHYGLRYMISCLCVYTGTFWIGLCQCKHI
jgi:hypothetical protein